MFSEAEENATRRFGRKNVSVLEHKRKSKRTHEVSFENLPVDEFIHGVAVKACPNCGEQTETVGKEFVRDELVYVPARLFLRKHYTEVVKCAPCAVADESLDALYADVPASVFKKVMPPALMIPHSFCSPKLLAHVLYEKYAMVVPLERPSKDFRIWA